MKEKVITSITTQLGKQISVVHERGILNSRRSLNRTHFSKEKTLYITSSKARSFLTSILNHFH